ncbi:MAG: hypothetical protein JW797_06765 [Bradymonadales bacterium]|nr:hypothetical protein [Bradymonadales bacterium]
MGPHGQQDGTGPPVAVGTGLPSTEPSGEDGPGQPAVEPAALEGVEQPVVDLAVEEGTGLPSTEPVGEEGPGQPAVGPAALEGVEQPTYQIHDVRIGIPIAPPMLQIQPDQPLVVGEIRPVGGAVALDAPDDYGGAIALRWERSPDDPEQGGAVSGYWISYQARGEGCAPDQVAPSESEPAAQAPPGEPAATEEQWLLWQAVGAGETNLDFEEAKPGCDYRFQVEAVSYQVDLDGPTLLGIPLSQIVLRSPPVMTEFARAQADLLAEDDGLDPRPPARAIAQDKGWDAGGVLLISWDASPDDDYQSGDGFLGYDLLVTQDPEGFWSRATLIGAGEPGVYRPDAAPGEPAYSYELQGIDLQTPYYLRVVAISQPGHSASPVLGPVVPEAAWFDGELFFVVILGLILCALVLYYILMARRGKKAFIRKIAGLEAIDEAIGRATEMGRPILFVPGISDMDNVQTLAGLTLLGHVSKTIAEYDTKIDVPCCRSLVMTAGREVVKQAYLEAGRPDAFDENCVHYLTDDQFGYVAGVNGICVRDKPATCFFQGGFYAESLILAETGNSIGAIQIAGTAMTAQLPFFVAACDYTLIGEELFAASAYLSGDPKQLGSLKGQDMGKLLAMAVVGLGTLLATGGSVAARFGAGSTAERFFGWVMEWLYRVFA